MSLSDETRRFLRNAQRARAGKRDGRSKGGPGRRSHEDHLSGARASPAEKQALAEATLRHRLAMARKQETAVAVMEGRLVEVDPLREAIVRGMGALRAGLEKFVHGSITGQEAVEVIEDAIRAALDEVDRGIEEGRERGRGLG